MNITKLVCAGICALSTQGFWGSEESHDPMGLQNGQEQPARYAELVEQTSLRLRQEIKEDMIAYINEHITAPLRKIDEILAILDPACAANKND